MPGRLKAQCTQDPAKNNNCTKHKHHEARELKKPWDYISQPANYTLQICSHRPTLTKAAPSASRNPKHYLGGLALPVLPECRPRLHVKV